MIKLIIILSSISTQQSDSTLSVEEAVAIALEQNYSIQIERNDVAIAQNNNSLGNAGFLPSVGLNSTANRSVRDTEQVLSFGDTEDVRSADGAKSTVYNVGIDLQWTLFDGFGMFASKNKLSEIEDMNRLEYKAAIQETVANVLKAFYNTALEQERLALLQSTLELSEERVSISKDRYEVGKASKLEYLQAQVDYNTDKSALVRQQEQITTSKYDLWQLMAVNGYADNLSLAYAYEVDSTIMLNETIDQALISNPRLRAIQSNRDVATWTIREEQSQLFPELNFNLGYAYSAQQNEVGVMRSNRALGFNYGFSATMPIFNGFNQRRQIQNARIQAETADIAYEEAKTQLITSIRSAYLTYRNSLQLVQLEEENLAVAKENEEIALERYRIGRSNPLEIREAQNNAVNAQIRYLEALATAKLAEIELMRLSGQIIE